MQKINLEGCLNFRDLGGYDCGGGKQTKSNKIYRSDCFSKLTDNDIKILKQLEIKCIISVRQKSEMEASPYPLNNHPYFKCYNVELSDDIYSIDSSASDVESMVPLYKALIDKSSGNIIKVFKVMIKNKDDNIAVHCTLGKDRTGVIVALLLGLCGVSNKDIIENYSQTFNNIQPYVDKIVNKAKKFNVTIPLYAFQSNPEYMEEFLSYLEEKYKGAEQYLIKNGLSQDEISTLKSLLIPD